MQSWLQGHRAARKGEKEEAERKRELEAIAGSDEGDEAADTRHDAVAASTGAHPAQVLLCAVLSEVALRHCARRDVHMCLTCAVLASWREMS